MQITGIILAGGQSSRMGTDKAMLQIDGKTLLKRATEICKPICNEILLSSNKPKHENFGFTVIPDVLKNCGPMGGIYSCLKKSETDWNFVISVDSVFVPDDFISFLISETGEIDAVVPIHKNGKEPLIALYHKNCLTAIQKKLELKDYKMHHLLDSLNTRYVDVDAWIKKYPEIFRNFNRPEDLVF
jgi:molybdopterin-guanine dinucleotide biosynthesis protein A